jgi:hypothetical protein
MLLGGRRYKIRSRTTRLNGPAHRGSQRKLADISPILSISLRKIFLVGYTVGARQAEGFYGTSSSGIQKNDADGELLLWLSCPGYQGITIRHIKQYVYGTVAHFCADSPPLVRGLLCTK